MNEIAGRIARAQERIGEALARSGRPPGSVRLVAVSKTFPPEAVADAAHAGLTTFGENRVQEATSKIARVAEIVSPVPSWHLVGHLQGNKAKLAVALFDLIHSVHDRDLARRLDAAAAGTNKRQAVLVQVNVAGESTKSGVAPESLRDLVEFVAACRNLELRGLMTIPPYESDPGLSRPYFAALRQLGEAVGTWLDPETYPGELSMGMSEDFEIAIEEGATMVRIGRALFGERPAN